METQCEVILTIPNARVYSLHPTDKRLLSQGDLSFLSYPQISLFGLTVGEYSCTLFPQLPVCKAEERIYLISDFDGFIGVVLSETSQETEALDALLLEHTQFEVQEQPRTYSERLGNWLQGASESLKTRMVNGSTRAGNSLKSGGEAVKSRLAPCAEERKVYRIVQTSAKGVKAATSFIAGCSQTVSEKAGRASGFVGKVVASGYTKLVGEKTESTEPSGAVLVASGALKALKTLLDAAEESVVILAKSAHETTVGVVQHRYGSELSGVVSDGLGSVGDLGRASQALSQLTPLTLARCAVEGGLEPKQSQS